METQKIILSIILIGAVVVPVWLLIRASNKSRKHLTRELIRIYKALPDCHDIWNQRAIALKDHTLTFIQLTPNQTACILDPDDINESYLLRNGKRTSAEHIDPQKTNTLDLVLVVHTPFKKSFTWNVYDHQVDDPVLVGQHIVVAKKWTGILKGLVRH